jgi:hypothetical protein
VRRRRTLLIVPGGLFLAFAVLALPAKVVNAQSSCSANCKAAYGACYKKNQDRSRCQGQLQRCLEGCIRSKR